MIRSLGRSLRSSILFFASAALICAGVSGAVAQSPATAGKLQILFVDVEGGQATLFVTPTGQSLLIDTGWPGRDGRDAKRIVAAAKTAGVTKLDYVLLTHFHDDHVGGVPQLAALIPIGTFIDHGINREGNDAVTAHGYAAYQQVLAGGTSHHIVAHPGDVLPITGMTVTVVSADGDLLKEPLQSSRRSGGGETNAFCTGAPVRDADQTENARSLGVQIVFGGLRILDLGDLTGDKEMQLVCPANRLGREDIYIVSHHGWMQSSTPAMVDALHARVAIMDNGEKKGGSLPVMQTLLKAPGLETLWQLHSSAEAGPAFNTAEPYIANPLGTDAGYALKLTADPSGSFAVQNLRTGMEKVYAARPGA